MTSIIKVLTAAKDLVKKLGNEAANADAGRVKKNVEGIVKELNDSYEQMRGPCCRHATCVLVRSSVEVCCVLLLVAPVLHSCFILRSKFIANRAAGSDEAADV